ncbi:hypothetical protein [Salinimicrobium oceani]|uniref:Uncharacterized protein n=1 Tax=Salinimicrobium oceani TaxID=2722702 RepID=A0ABX1CXA8_9FLAO|nr:hypothetical protein [Salinimicrobium oceani]NJW51579.1 hypothetical protein [Salinimicrobium oceani]
MALDGKHSFGSIGETRVSFIEKKIHGDRKEFLTRLLEHNQFEVLVEEEKRKTPEEPQLYTLGVTDITFNPVVAVFERKLKTFDGRKVTPAYWNQLTNEAKPQYWE